jgi:hypothetical protein
MPGTMIASFSAIQFACENVGPFRSGYPAVVRFMGAHPRSADALRPAYARKAAVPALLGDWSTPDQQMRRRFLSRIFFLLGDEGFGKTTILESIHGLFGLLTGESAGPFDDGAADPAETVDIVADNRMRMQIDLLASCVVDGALQEVILSIWFGSIGPLVDWTDAFQEGPTWGATEWARIGFIERSKDPTEGTNELGAKLLAALRSTTDMRKLGTSSVSRLWNSRSVAVEPLPTCLLFRFGDRTPGREERRIGGDSSYRSTCEVDLAVRSDLQVNLLRMRSDQPEKFERLLKHLNAKVFFGPGRRRSFGLLPDGTGVGVDIGGNDVLRSVAVLTESERALFALHAGTWVHGTRGSLIIVDAVDRFAKEEFAILFQRSIASLAECIPDITFLLASRDVPMARTFAKCQMGSPLPIGGQIIAGWFIP